MKREKFSTQLGFLLTTAGCAIGLGNIYRFPYIVGQYGGALFVIVYAICLILLGIPLVTMELAVGRASRVSAVKAFEVLKPGYKGRKVFQSVPVIANYMYNMFYTTITAQMLYYTVMTVTGKLSGKNAQEIKMVSTRLSGRPILYAMLMVIVVVFCFFVCIKGLRNSVEKYSKYMLSFLFVIMLILAVRSLTLDGAREGVRFYLYPSIEKMEEYGMGEIISAALGQAFFTLGIGAGSICLFGSYMDKNKSLAGQATMVVILDTAVAFAAGLIIFPACFTYGVAPQNGPNLLVDTMPNIFNHMAGGRFWGSMFFVAVLLAALTTVIASFENIIGVTMDVSGWSRKKAVMVNLLPMILLSLPSILGMNVWNTVKIGGRDIMGIEDFMVSNCFLPVGAFLYLLFCVTGFGWGWKSFLEEVNVGKGFKIPMKTKGYFKYVLPIIVIIIFIMGFVN